MVRHLIVFNIPEGATHDDCLAMAKLGKQDLSKIPGVLRVAFGTAVKADARYRYTLAIDFQDRSVIDSYRDHPIHVRFADDVFRPLATDRITSDYDMDEE